MNKKQKWYEDLKEDIIDLLIQEQLFIEQQKIFLGRLMLDAERKGVEWTDINLRKYVVKNELIKDGLIEMGIKIRDMPFQLRIFLARAKQEEENG